MRALVLAAAGAVALAGTAAAAPPLVDADWLETRLDAPNLAVLDIRNAIDGGAATAYRAGHIPGAVHSSYTEDGWRTSADGVPGLLPPIGDLEALVGGLGIAPDDHVVIVHAGTGATDFGSAARVFWTFEQLGHAEVSILDGGMAAWTADASRPLARGVEAVTPVAYDATPPADAPLTSADVVARLDGGATLVDARPREQFDGVTKHAAATRAGHVQGAAHFPQSRWFDASGARRDVDAVAAELPDAVANGAGEVVSYCNTGHWAATNWFMLSRVLGRANVTLYDGSMTAWTRDPDRPVATRAP
jgi:thiosulfate/3-mercaptopyruvate sulfurtransferase